jgi:hypothetical protein
MLRLNVSGLQITIRRPTGVEDMLLQERQSGSVELALDVVSRLVQAADGARVSWRELCVSDLEALLLMMRQNILGDMISTDARCPAAGCGARVDISFGIGEYLQSRRPRKVKNVEQSPRKNWFRLQGEAVEFRLPTAGDLLAIENHADPHRELANRCMRPTTLKPALRRRVENAMEALSPRYSSTLKGVCPECGAGFEIYFDVRSFVLQELHNRAAGVYQDVHLLALHYKWPEEQILALPQNRRAYYAEMLRGAEATA